MRTRTAVRIGAANRDTVKDTILAAGHVGINLRQAAKVTGFSLNTIKWHAAALIAAGVIERSGPPSQVVKYGAPGIASRPEQQDGNRWPAPACSVWRYADGMDRIAREAR